MAKDVMISSVGPGGKRTPVSIHRMNGKIKTITSADFDVCNDI